MPQATDWLMMVIRNWSCDTSGLLKTLLEAQFNPLYGDKDGQLLNKMQEKW